MAQQAEDGDGQMAAGTHALASVKPADLAQHRVRSGQEAHFIAANLWERGSLHIHRSSNRFSPTSFKQ
jgi:hypothetical protein